MYRKQAHPRAAGFSPRGRATVYNADIPEFNVAIDRYERWAQVFEFEAPRRIDPTVAAERLDQVVQDVAEVLGLEPTDVVVKQRRRQRRISTLMLPIRLLPIRMG